MLSRLHIKQFFFIITIIIIIIIINDCYNKYVMYHIIRLLKLILVINYASDQQC